MILPGEIYFADFGTFGPHPVIVISRESLNRGNYVVVVVCTSSRFQERRRMANCVVFKAGEFGFTTDCVAQSESITSMSKTRIDFGSGLIGKVNPMKLREINKAIGHVMACDCEPA